MTFYQDHRKLFAQSVPPPHCLTVDASQGAEYELGILSTGRRNASSQSVGFLDDRRRITVAVSRWQHKLIILLNREVGGHNGGGGHSVCEGQTWWANFRDVANRIDAVFDAGDLHGADFRALAHRL